MTLTTKEKADRYDSLMLAISEEIKWLTERADELEGQIKNPASLDVIEGFNYGRCTGFRQAAEEMRRWV